MHILDFANAFVVVSEVPPHQREALLIKGFFEQFIDFVFIILSIAFGHRVLFRRVRRCRMQSKHQFHAFYFSLSNNLLSEDIRQVELIEVVQIRLLRNRLSKSAANEDIEETVLAENCKNIT